MTRILLLTLTLLGCQHQTELQTQRRKHHDRHQILQHRPTQFYSQYDAAVWSDNNTYEPRPAAGR